MLLPSAPFLIGYGNSSQAFSIIDLLVVVAVTFCNFNEAVWYTQLNNEWEEDECWNLLDWTACMTMGDDDDDPKSKTKAYLMSHLISTDEED